MNDKDRTRIRKACTDCDREVRKAIYIFGNEVDGMKYSVSVISTEIAPPIAPGVDYWHDEEC